MKGKFFVLLVFVFCGSLAFAQTKDTAHGAQGISDSEVSDLITKYLENTFNTFLNRSDLRVTELSCTTDWNASNQEENKKNGLIHYNAQARFRNFPINNRILSGRLETNVVIRKNAGAVLGLVGGKPGILDEDQENRNITLFIYDQLSDELRDSMVKDYITKNYQRPLDIKINNEKLEVFPDKIYSYVTGVVNNDRIVSLRVVFEIQEPKIEKVGIFTIQETAWQQNRAEVIFSELFPDNEMLKTDLRTDMFDPIRGYYRNTIGKANPLENGSKVESISKRELKEANDSTIKMELDLEYLLDLSGFIGSIQRYRIIMNTIYQFDFEKRVWVYQSIGGTTDNITVRR